MIFENLTLEHPAFLLLIVAALLITLFSWLKNNQAFSTCFLRFLSLSIISIALANPQITSTSETNSITALFDVSESISLEGKRAFGGLLEEYLEIPNTSLEIYPFSGASSSSSFQVSSKKELKEFLASVKNPQSLVDTGKTNIGASLLQATRASGGKAALLLTDGNNNAGELGSSINQLSLEQVSVFPLIPNEKPFLKEKLSIVNLRAPLKAQSGSIVQISTSISNSFNSKKSLRAEIWLAEKKLSEKNLTLPENQEKVFSASSKELKGGLHRIKALIFDKSGELIDEEHRWISVEEPEKLLLISGTQDDNRVISSVLGFHGYTVDNFIANGRKKIPTTFSNYSLIILNNVSKKQLPAGFLKSLESFVKIDGGGLVMIGGSRSYGLGGYRKSVLEKISPVKFLPPRTKKKRLVSAVALVIDKSRSMRQGDRIRSAKLAALTSIDALKDDDYVSVIGFDSAPFVIIKMAKVREVKPSAERRLRNLTAAGKTNLLPALHQARNSLVRSKAGRKHIIVLTDGEVPDAGTIYFKEVNSLRQKGITVSTVALGAEAAADFMKELASLGKGAFYHTLNPSELPQIFLRDIKVSVGEETMREGELFPVSIGPDGLISAGGRRFPEVKGFVETKVKPAANLELVTIKESKDFPILASWSYGLGRAIAFTSDANGRWSEPWLKRGQKQFVKFWGDILETAKPKKGEKAKDLDFDLRHSVNSGALELSLSVFDKQLSKKSSPQISARVKTPDGTEKVIAFSQDKPGKFLSNLKGVRPGDYQIDISYGSQKFPPLGITLRGELFEEKQGEGLNIQVLNDIAHKTKGEVNPNQSADTFKKLTSKSKKSYFLPLILLAFILVLLEAIWREVFLGRSS